MSKDWDDYLPDVILEASSCPTLIAVNAIRSAAIELCQERNVWREELDRLNLLAADALCDISVPAGTEIATILEVRFHAVGATQAQKVFGPFDERTLNTLRPGWKDEKSQGTRNSVDCCTYPSPLVLQVIPAPVVSQSEAISVYASLRPTRSSTNGHDLLYTDHLETITTGALAKLLAMGDKPWTNLTIALDKRAQFKAKKAAAGIRVLTGGGAQPLSVHPRTLA